ncbi:metallophosphoesterase family protein [Latilactobacillus sakei]|uniref:metallophosphoesterase family protein n=1 Tax=Latilactobacillus sakei TaxID=1599 RepID=UPI003F53C046
MANQVDYRDPTPNNFPQDYDPSKVDSRVKLRSESIKHKQKGKHTREAMYQALEIGSVTANEAKTTALDTANRQDESEKKVHDTSDNVNNVLAEITKNSGDSAAPEVIAARDDGEQSFKSLGERLNQTLSIDDSIDGYAIRNVFRPEINRVKELINPDNLNLLFITDLHWEQDNSNAYAHSNRSLSHLSNALAFDDKVDAIILGGDNTNSYSKSLSYIKKQIEQINDKLYDTGSSDRFSLLGNHDDGSMRSRLLSRSLKPEDIVLKRDFINLMRANNSNYGEIRMADNLAFYKDYADKKVRVIGLNALDIPDGLTNEDGSIKYNRQHKFGYSSSQLKWLAETALTGVPEDYHTVVFSHIHTNPAPVTESITETTDVRFNYDLLQQLLWAFQAGTAVVLNNELKDFEVDLTIDFTAQGKRTLVGFINGHTHWEGITKVGTFTDVHCLNSIYEGAGDELVNQAPGQPDRKLNDVTEDAFTIISIDTTKKHVDLIGFGAATNRGFDYA